MLHLQKIWEVGWCRWPVRYIDIPEAGSSDSESSGEESVLMGRQRGATRTRVETVDTVDWTSAFSDITIKPFEEEVGAKLPPGWDPATKMALGLLQPVCGTINHRWYGEPHQQLCYVEDGTERYQAGPARIFRPKVAGGGWQRDAGTAGHEYYYGDLSAAQIGDVLEPRPFHWQHWVSEHHDSEPLREAPRVLPCLGQRAGTCKGKPRVWSSLQSEARLRSRHCKFQEDL